MAPPFLGQLENCMMTYCCIDGGMDDFYSFLDYRIYSNKRLTSN